MRIKDHLAPILHGTIANLLSITIPAVLGLVVAIVPSLRDLALNIAMFSVPLWSALAVTGLTVLFLVVRTRTPAGGSDQTRFVTNDFPADLATRLRASHKAVFWGTAFVKFIPSLRDDLEARLKAGSHIQFLLIHPEGAALRMANLRGRPEDIPHRQSDLLRSLATLSALSQTGRLELKLLDYLAPYAMVIFDEDDPDQAHMYVWLATLGVPNKQRPMFELSRARDPIWFAFFAEQFKLTWEKASAHSAPPRA